MADYKWSGSARFLRLHAIGLSCGQMGFIKRQALRHTSLSWIGAMIGALSNLFIYPLAWELYGFAQFMIGFAALLVPIATLGLPNVSLRYFPAFGTKKRQSGHFLTALLLGLAGGYSVLVFALFLGQDAFLRLLSTINMDPEIFADNRYLAMALVGFLGLSSLLSAYISNYKKVAVPVFFNNLMHKVLLPLLILSFFWGLLNLDGFKIGFAGIYAVSLVGLIWYLRRLTQIRLSINLRLFTRELSRRMGLFALFSALTSIGSMLAFRIDILMISGYLGYEQAGFYSFFLFMTNVIAMPYNAMVAITNPAISQAWIEKDVREIGKIYRRSSEMLFLAALFILLGAWLCLEDLLSLTSNLRLLLPYKEIFLLIGLGQMVNLVTSTNQAIISFSPWYWFNLLCLLGLGGLTIYLNYLFIPVAGLVGAAYATAIAIFAYNVMKFVFIWWKFGIQPLSMTHLKGLSVGAVAFISTYLLPGTGNHLLNILLHGFCFALLFGSATLYLRVSPDINQLWAELKIRIIRHFD